MSARRDERGFTLIELVVAVTVSAVVLGGLGTGLMAVLRLSGATTDRIAATHDLEQLRRFLVSDVHSADATTTVVPHVPAAGEASCATGDPVDGFSMRWSNPATGKLYRATYSRSGTDLGRSLAEVDAAGATVSTVRTDTVVHHLQDPSLGAADLGGFPGRFPLCMVTGDLPIVHLGVTVLIREGAKPASAQLSFPVKVVPRTGEYALGNPTGSTTPTTVTTPLPPTATLTSPAGGTAFRGNLTATATASTTGTLGQVGVEYKLPSSATWTAVESPPCTTSPCSMVLKPGPLGLADGPLELRAWAKDVLGQTGSSSAATVTFDATGPGGAWTAPVAGAVLKGSFGLAVDAADATSGVQSVAFARGGTAVATVASPTSGASYGTTFDPAGAPDGPATFTATVTDRAGNATQVSRAVTLDNAGPAGAITAPAAGSKRRGAITITGSASDAYSGVSAAKVQLKPSGGSFTDVPTTLSGGSFSAVVDTRAFGDGPATVQVVLTDGLGNTSTTGPLEFQIDNLRPSATRLATTNGGTAEKLDQGDAIVVTFSEAIDPSTVCAGLSTTAEVTVTVKDAGTNDVLSVDGCTFGSVALGGDYHKTNQAGSTTSYGNKGNPSTITWDASALTLTLRLGKDPNPSAVTSSSAASYAPDGSIKDQAGNPVDSTPAQGGTQRF